MFRGIDRARRRLRSKMHPESRRLAGLRPATLIRVDVHVRQKVQHHPLGRVHNSVGDGRRYAQRVRNAAHPLYHAAIHALHGTKLLAHRAAEHHFAAAQRPQAPLHHLHVQPLIVQNE